MQQPPVSQTAYPVSIATQPPIMQSVPVMMQRPQQQNKVKVSATKGLAITQIILGALSVIAGLLMLLLDFTTFRGLNDNGYLVSLL